MLKITVYFAHDYCLTQLGIFQMAMSMVGVLTTTQISWLVKDER